MFAQSQGIQGLPRAQQAPGQRAGMAPGQAAPQQVVPQKQSATPASKIAALESQLIPLSPGNAAMLEQRKMQLMQMYAQEPTIELLERLTKTAEAIKTANAQTQQQAMAAYAQQGPQTVADMVRQDAMATTPAAQGGIMQGFSGGGAVAFERGGNLLVREPDETDEEYEERKRRLFSSGLGGVSGIPMYLPPPSEERDRLNRIPFDLASAAADAVGRGWEKLTEGSTIEIQRKQRAAEAEAKKQEALAALYAGYRGRPSMSEAERAAAYVRAGLSPSGATAQLASRQAVEDRGFVPDMAPPRAPRPGTGRPTTPAPAPAAAAPTPEVTPAPKTDNWADIEQQGLKGIAALQDVYRKQSGVDPELARLRGAAYESAQSIAQRRERDRLAALEAAQKAATAPLMDNQEALLRLAGSIGGKMRFGEALGAMAGAAGGIRGDQRKALEAAQRESRLEQNAIDQLNQALAEKRVADRSGDVERRRAADRRVAEAQLKVTELRSSVQEKRATEADRAEQRALTKRGQDITRQTSLDVARIGASAREGTADVAQQRLAIQAMRADPNYASVVKELTEAQKVAAISKSPAAQARLSAAKAAASNLANAYGVNPAMVGGAAPAAPTDTAAPTDPLGIRKP